MHACVSDKHQLVLRMTKQLDAQMTAQPHSLASLCSSQIQENLTVESAPESLKLADHLQDEALKTNILKFVSLNIVSYFDTGNVQKLADLPVYLLRDL